MLDDFWNVAFQQFFLLLSWWRIRWRIIQRICLKEFSQEHSCFPPFSRMFSSWNKVSLLDKKWLGSGGPSFFVLFCYNLYSFIFNQTTYSHCLHRLNVAVCEKPDLEQVELLPAVLDWQKIYTTRGKIASVPAFLIELLPLTRSKNFQGGWEENKLPKSPIYIFRSYIL